MTCRVLVIALILVGEAAMAAGQAGGTAVPQPCPDCAKAADEAAPIRKQIEERNAELRRLQQEQGANNANLRNLRELRLDSARRNDKAAVEQYDKSIDDLQGDNKVNREQQFKTQQDIRLRNEELEKIGREVDACNKRCFEFVPKLPTGFVESGTDLAPEPPPTPEGVAVPPLRTPPPCDDCKKGVSELEKEHQELRRQAERANATKERGPLRDFEEQRRKVRELQRQVDGCNQKCTPKPTGTTTSFKDPRVLGGVAGGAVLVALLAGGGGDTQQAVVAPAPIVGTPQTPPATTTQPSPPAAPVEPQPTVAGVHDCLECAAVDDAGGHNSVVRLCDFAGGPWDIAVASITIRHAAPFVNIEGASFDTTSGVFRGTTRGTVAGIPNVGIAIDGTANAQTGRVTFTYTMGTGGELPGGRSITYRITLQKRR